MAHSTNQNTGATTEGFDPSRWAHTTFAVATFLLAWLGVHLVDSIWATLWSEWPLYVPRVSQTWTNVFGILAGLLVGIYLWRDQRRFKYVCQVAVEVSQVVWPTRAETKSATVVVIVITIICSFLLFFMDTFWSNITDWIYNL